MTKPESKRTGGRQSASRRATLRLTAALAVVATSVVACREQPAVFPLRAWQTRAPAELGLDGPMLERFAARIGSSPGDSGVIIKDGYIAKAWGDPAARIDWASAGKSALSTMLLFALKEGTLSSLDDPVVDWGWAVSSDPAERLQGKDRAITFHHLANMTSGFDRVEGPGEAYAYNDNAVQLYAKTLLRVFDAERPRTAFNDEALKPARLGPLQFEDGPVFGTTDPIQERRAETALVTSPRDFARVGWLWLNRGNWRGEQLLPESYFTRFAIPLVPNEMPLSVAEAMKYLLIGTWGNQFTFDSPFGPGVYGLHWWFNGLVGTTSRRHWPDAPLDTFAAIGNYPEEAMFVIPSLRMVVAAHGDWSGGSYDTPPLEGSRGQPHRYWDPGDPDGDLNEQLELLAAAAR